MCEYFIDMEEYLFLSFYFIKRIWKLDLCYSSMKNGMSNGVFQL